MIDTCERCDGVGCRYCSGRGWVERVTEPFVHCNGPIVQRARERNRAFHESLRRVRRAEEHPRPALTEDRDQDHGECEPEERIRITVQYPDHPVKLLRVRYGTLSRALAEAFNGRPW